MINRHDECTQNTRYRYVLLKHMLLHLYCKIFIWTPILFFSTASPESRKYSTIANSILATFITNYRKTIHPWKWQNITREKARSRSNQIFNHPRLFTWKLVILCTIVYFTYLRYYTRLCWYVYFSDYWRHVSKYR